MKWKNWGYDSDESQSAQRRDHLKSLSILMISLAKEVSLRVGRLQTHVPIEVKYRKQKLELAV